MGHPVERAHHRVAGHQDVGERVCVCVCVSGKEGHPIGLRGTKQHPISTGNMPHGVWGVAWSWKRPGNCPKMMSKLPHPVSHGGSNWPDVPLPTSWWTSARVVAS